MKIYRGGESEDDIRLRAMFYVGNFSACQDWSWIRRITTCTLISQWQEPSEVATFSSFGVTTDHVDDYILTA